MHVRSVTCALALSLIALLSSASPLARDFELSAYEQRWLAEHHTIRYAGDPNWLPFEAFDEQGRYVGIVAAFLQRFTQDTGIQVEFVTTRSWDETLLLAQQGQVDVMSDVLGSIAIHNSHHFTAPYLSNSLVLLADEVGGEVTNLSTIAGSKIGIINGYGYTWALFQNYPDAEFVIVNSFQEGVAALAGDDIQYLITTYALGQFQRARLAATSLTIRGRLPFEAELAFAVRNDWPELEQIMNRWIASLTPAERYQIAENWYLEHTDYFASETVNWNYTLALLAVIVVLLGLMLFTWLSRRQIKAQKQRFETALAAIKATEWKLPYQSAKLELPSTFASIVPTCVTHPKSLGEFIELIAPEHRDMTYEAFKSARQSELGVIDIEFRLNSETPCWLALKGGAIQSFNKKPTLTGTLENITLSKQAQMQQQQQEALLTLLFDAIPDLVVLEFFDQRDTIANKAYRHYFQSHTMAQSLPEDQRGLWQQQEQTLVQHKRPCTIASWLNTDLHRKAYFSIIRTPFLDADKNVIGVLSVARDMTDTFLLQQELENAKQQADQANASKSIFLANMSHEIRTPLNAILGYAQLLQQKDEFTEQSSRQIERIYSAGQRLLNLINDILDLSKIEAGRLQLNPEKIALKRELEDLLSLHSQRAQDKGLAFHQSVLLDARDHCRVDRTKLGQILLNALDNAVKFTQKGSISVKIDYQAPNLRMRIEDTGPGISASELEQLFQPFSQGASGNINGGTGLGLVLSRRIAEAMEGEFVLHSTPNRGTQIEIFIPLTLTSETPASAGQQHWQLPSNSSAHALVIEDDELSRDMLQGLLEGMGFTVICAENGAQALNCLDVAIDIIFSDIRMPQMDGVTLLQHIRTQSALADIPIIAVTASSFDHERRYYLAQGFSEFIAKPIALSRLYQVIQQFMTLVAKPQANPCIEPSSPIPACATTVSDAEVTLLLERLCQACELGDADEALIVLNKLQDSDYPVEKLDIIRSNIAQYDFDRALQVIR
ncbi:ATP-binding protein [Marinomonas ostreistagni]|uniref:ATP-binding protein n=1 Tax=Marinomonas ostreistagni TaxID=359209 RepID=UPI001951D527|nr:ATP-binding protein [Marinomonas ostreistagni]MBM6550792.1 response regulator [Marinomonas ostreistagni]